MGIFNSLKDVFSPAFVLFNKFTPEYLDQNKKEMPGTQYVEWLKGRYSFYSSMVYAQKTKGLIIPKSWVDVLILIEKEMDIVGARGVGEKKMSEDFNYIK